MSPALIEALLDVARRASEAGHGGKDAVYAAACRKNFSKFACAIF